MSSRANIANARLHLGRAEEFFALGHQNFGRVWAASGLRQAYALNTPANSFDWALVVAPPKRSNNEKTLKTPNKCLNEVLHYLLERSVYLIDKGRSSGISMGMYGGERTTVLQSWKLDSHGVLWKTITCEDSIAPLEDLHGNGSLYFGRVEDSGSAVVTQGGFVGLLFASNEFSGTSFFTATETLFTDIMKLTSLQRISQSWTCASEHPRMRFQGNRVCRLFCSQMSASGASRPLCSLQPVCSLAVTFSPNWAKKA